MTVPVARLSAPASLEERLAPYVPRLLVDWHRRQPHERWQRREGSMLSADISGFTKLSERLARLGTEGAEELTDLINECFDAMIGIAEAHGGDILKFGGDALLVLFTGPDHALRACGTAIGMRSSIARPLSTRSVPHVTLKMSQGIHSGAFDLFMVDAGHQELLVVGPGVTETVDCEAEAAAGEILLSRGAAALVPPTWLGPAREERGRRSLRRIVYLADIVDVTNAPDVVGVAELIAPAQRAEIEAGATSEHRRVTTAFVKFSHIDELLALQGPDEVGRRLEAVAAAVRDAATSYGVQWLASDVYADGGKAILTAGAPVSTGHDEDRMLRAVRAVVDADPGLHLRAGVNAGRVFTGIVGSRSRRVYTVMGDAVNLAARLMQRAEAGQVIAAADAVGHAATTFATQALPPFHVKGKAAPIEAALVGAPLADHAGSRRTAGLDVPLVGRDDELQLLLGAAAAAARGATAVVDIVGDIGMGKTRLLTDLQQRLGTIATLAVRGGQYSRATPYYALTGGLRQLLGIPPEAARADAGAALRRVVARTAPALEPWLPLLAAPIDAEVESTVEVDELVTAFRRQRLHATLVELLDAFVDGPVLVAVDDAHLLDEASADLLRALVGQGRAGGQVVVLAREPAQSGDPSGPLLDAAGRPATLTLGPLARESIVALIVGASPRDLLPDVIDRLADHAGGNPLFAIELARSAADGSAALPDTIDALVTARIDTLAPRARQLLRDASVLGMQIDLRLAAEAFEVEPSEAGETWAALRDFTAPGGPGLLRFRHSSYRRVAYEGLAFRRRRELHQRIARALEGRGAADELAALLSLHFHHGQCGPEAWQYSLLAGAQARAKYANVEAAAFYGRAIESAGWAQRTRQELREVWTALGDVSELSARYDVAAHAYAEARRRARGEIEIETELARKSGVVAERHGKYADALRWYSRGLRVAESLSGRQRQTATSELARAYAGVRYRQGRWEECVLWARRAAEDAAAVDDRAGLAHAWYLLDIALSSAGSADAANYRGRAAPVFEELGDLIGLANALNNDGVTAYYESRWAEAIDCYERSREARDRSGDVVGAATQANNIGEVLSDQGKLDEARALFVDALRTWRAAAYPVGIGVATCNLGRLEARAGDYDAGLRLLDEAKEIFRTMGATALEVDVDVRKVECLLLAGRIDDALLTVDATEARLRRGEGDDLLQAVLDRIAGSLLLRAGQRDAAQRRFDASLRRAVAVEADYEAALARLGLAVLHAPTDPPASRRYRLEAAAVLERLGVIAVFALGADAKEMVEVDG